MVDQLGYEQGEIVDKVFYINPTNGLTLTPKTITFDNTDYVYENGELLGDHVPVAVTFEVTGNTFKPVDEVSWWVGEKNPVANGQYYLCNVKYGTYISSSDKPTVLSVAEAPLWSVNGSNTEGKHTLKTVEGESRVQIKVGFSWTATIANKSASDLDFVEGTRSDAIKLKATYKGVFNDQIRYFGVDYADKKYYYDAQETPDFSNDWLFITEEQKQEYLSYVKAYNSVMKYADLDLPTGFKGKNLQEEFLELMNANDANYNNCPSDNGYTNRLNVLEADILEWLDTFAKKDYSSEDYNFSFETGDLTGWTTYPAAGGEIGVKENANDVYNMSNADGSYVFNIWDSNPSTFKLTHNTITGLLDGMYMLTAIVGSDVNSTIQFTANNTTSTFITKVDNSANKKNAGEQMSVLFSVKGGTLDFSVSSSSWFEVDNFVLTKYNNYYDVTVGSALAMTLCLPANTTIPEGVKVYYATEFHDQYSTVHLEQYEDAVLPMNTGVVIFADEAKEYRFFLATTEGSAMDGNLLVGVNERTIPENFNDYYYYVLAKQGESVGFSRLRQLKNDGTANAVPANRAYIPRMKSEESDNADSSKAFFAISLEDGQASALESVVPDSSLVKGVYSIDGIRHANAVKGISIIRMSDGSVKKVFTK